MESHTVPNKVTNKSTNHIPYFSCITFLNVFVFCGEYYNYWRSLDFEILSNIWEISASPELETNVLSLYSTDLECCRFQTVKQPLVVEQDERVRMMAMISFWTWCHFSGPSQPHTSLQGSQLKNTVQVFSLTLSRRLEQVSLSFNLITVDELLKLKHRESLKKGWRQDKCGWSTNKPLKTHRNRTRGNTKWSCNPDS